DEGWRAEAVVADLHHVAQLSSIERWWQMLEETTEVGFVEFLRRRELPEHRAEMLSELEHAGIEEMLDRVARLLQHTPVHGKPRSFDRKDKTVRHFACPFAKSRGRLRAVKGAVDLDRGEALARVGKLLRVRQPFGIEHSAPGLVGPSADANTD